MKTRISSISTLPKLAAPLLALPLILAFVPRADDISFGPESGASVTKELELDLQIYLEDVSVSVDGQEMPSEMIMGALGEGIVINAAITVTDEFVKSAGGRPLELLRTYDSMSLEGGPEGETESMDEIAEYEDSTVRFKWNEEDEEYTVTFAEDEGDDDVLVGLSVDMDFLALLPDGEVSAGDTWEVGGAEIGNVFLPGGSVPLDIGEDDSELPALIEDSLKEQFEQAFSEFSIRCEYMGERDEGGTRVGAITFKFDGEASLDLTDVISEVITALGDELGADVEADVSATLDLEVKGEGTMLWDLEAHHVKEFEMSSDLTVLADIEADVEVMGQSQSIEASAELSGEATWSMSVE